MPLLNVRTAAQLTGRDRSTITRLIEKGKLSATRDARGYYLIDPAELERVFGSLASPDARTDAAAMQRTGLHEAAQADARAREIEILHEMLEGERGTHQRERQTWEDERMFLRGLVERQTEQLKLLTFEHTSAQSTKKPRGRTWLFWRR